MSLVRSLVRSSASPLAISLLGGGALSLGARVDSELEELIEAGGTVSQIEVQDLTSMFVGTDGSGGNPTVGDSVGAIVGSEGFGGKSFEQWLAGEANLLDPSGYTADATSSVSNSGDVVTITTTDAGPGFINLVQSMSVPAGSWVYGEINIVSNNTNNDFLVQTYDGSGTDTLIDVSTNGATGVFTGLFKATNGITEIRPGIVGGTSGDEVEFELKIVVVSSLWSAPSDTARPILLDTFSDPNDSALTDNGGRGEELVDDADYVFSNAGSPAVDGSISSGVISLTRDDGSNFNRVTQAITTEVGAKYQFTFNNPSATFVNYRVGTTALGSDIKSSSVAAGGSYDEPFRATTTTTYISFLAAVDNEVSQASAISVRKVLSAFDERGPELTDAESVGANYVAYEFEAVDGETYEPTCLIDASNDSEHFIAIYSNTAGNGSLITQLDGAVGGVAEVGVQYTGPKFVATVTGTWHIRVTPKGGTGSSAGLSVTPSVKRVIYPNLNNFEDMSASSNWTYVNGEWVHDGLANANLSAGTILEPYKHYRVLTYIGTNGGNLRARAGDIGVTDASTDESGWWVKYMDTFDGGSTFLYRMGSVGTIGASIVQEVPASISRRYFLRFDGVDDQLTLTDTFGSDMTVVMGMKTSDTQGMLLNGDTTLKYIGCFHTGSSDTTIHAAAGAPSLRVDGAAISPANRGDLFTDVSDGEWHVATVSGANLSAWTEAEMGAFDGGTASFWTAYDVTYLAIFPSDPDTLALNEQLAAQVSGVTLP